MGAGPAASRAHCFLPSPEEGPLARAARPPRWTPGPNRPLAAEPAFGFARTGATSPLLAAPALLVTPKCGPTAPGSSSSVGPSPLHSPGPVWPPPSPWAGRRGRRSGASLGIKIIPPSLHVQIFHQVFFSTLNSGYFKGSRTVDSCMF